MTLRVNPKHITEANRLGSMSKFVGSNGEFNATDRKDLLKVFAEMASMISNGNMFTDVSGNNPEARPKINLREALLDSSSHMELGASLAAELQQRMQREGFMRSIIERGEVADGSTVRIRVRTQGVKAIVSKGIGQVYPQFVRDQYLNVDEYYIQTNVMVDELEMRQGSGDILEDKFYEAQEGIMVAEDRQILSQCRQTAGMYHPPIYFAGNYTPVIMQAQRQAISDFSLPLGSMLIANDIMSDFLVASEFSTWIDPITKYEIVQTGRIGTILGSTLITDGFREPSLQVLKRGEVISLTSPTFLGTYTDRGPVTSEPVTGKDKGQNSRGWSMMEMVSITLANAKGVIVAQRQ
jgi:hypothetical protein